jgi:hypothetical protein
VVLAPAGQGLVPVGSAMVPERASAWASVGGDQEGNLASQSPHTLHPGTR